MNLKEQEYVCALAENGTITAAAKELFISQPALSIYINNLEKSLGVRLFERVGKQFILTYAGEQYVEKAKLILQLSHELDEKLKDITGISENKLDITKIISEPQPQVIIHINEIINMLRKGQMEQLHEKFIKYIEELKR